jgi:hypothetical protein
MCNEEVKINGIEVAFDLIQDIRELNYSTGDLQIEMSPSNCLLTFKLSFCFD